MGNLTEEHGTLRLKFWGVRGSTPCANEENMKFGGNTTCLEIQIPEMEEVLILDSGTGIRNLGNRLTTNNGNIEGHIFITHPHWDHIQGFPFFKPIYNPENHFSIHMPAQEDGGCKEILAGHLTKTFFPVTLEMIKANLEYITQSKEEQQFGHFSVEFMLANHSLNTAIYKIRVKDKTIVFCPDNELCPSREKTGDPYYPKLKDFCYGADVLIHDAQYHRENYPKRIGWGHSCWEDAIDFAMLSGVENLFLTHHDPDSDDVYLSSLEQDIQKNYSSFFDTIQLAKEGEEIIL